MSAVKVLGTTTIDAKTLALGRIERMNRREITSAGRGGGIYMEEGSGEGREEGGNRDRGGRGVHERNDMEREGERYMYRGDSTERDTRCLCVCVCVCVSCLVCM